MGLASFGVMLVLIGLRMPVGLALFVTGSVGYVALIGWVPFIAYLKTTPFYLFSDYTLSVIPLFILMGALAEHSGLSQALFNAANAFVGHRRGGMAMASIGACTAFGAVCGSSVATTATMGRAAFPELRRVGYADRLAAGTLAVGGTLGILIPPSVILIVYAISTEQNIAKLFMAALIPGLMAAAFYMAAVALIVRRHPEAGPAAPGLSRPERWRALALVWPMLLVAVIVVGGIYGGVFTPTEGAGVGAVATLCVGLVERRLGLKGIKAALLQTAELTAMIFLVLLGAEIFNAFLAFSDLPNAAAEAVGGLGLPPYAVLAALLVAYLALGGLMDELAMILLTLPVFFPIVMALDLGMAPESTAIWFGILVLITVGIGLTSPPIGLNVFVMSAIARDVPLTTIFKGVLPFIAMDILRLVLVFLFPGLALFLVNVLT